MNYNYLLLLMIALCVGASFLKINRLRAETVKLEAVSVIDDYINGTKNKNGTSEDLLESKDGVSISQNSDLDAAENSANSSENDTMFDRYGNKTETRTFNWHPRVSRIMLITDAEGQRKVFVYGQNGSVKGLPEDMLDQAMTASPDAIANAAGIVVTPPRMPMPTFTQTIKTEKNSPSQTAPNYQIQNQTMESGGSEVKTKKLPAANSEENPSSVDNGNNPKSDPKTSTVNRQPEEK